MNRIQTGWVLLAVWLLSAADARAIILFSTADPNKNTTAPTGEWAGSGFELQGVWGNFQGTPIGPRHFITAAHVGGAVGQVFTFRGVHYTAINSATDPNSDLRIWEVAASFPEFADLYDGTSELGAELVVVGRGATRGVEVRVGGALKGWRWGTWDQRLRWGRNRVSELTNAELAPIGEPLLLKVNFDASGSADEAHLGVGDSGGAVFIKQGAAWRLAGINWAIDGPYNSGPAGAGFNGAFFDEGGLYEGGEGKWQPIFDLPIPQPSAFYATRIKARLEWIRGVLATRTEAPALLASADVGGPYMRVEDAVVDLAAKTIRVGVEAGPRFFELQSAMSLRIAWTRLEGGALVIGYE